MGISYNTSIVRDGLVLHLDAGNVKSYPGSGTLWKDMSGFSNTGDLFGGPTYDSLNNGSLSFDGVNDYSLVPSSDSVSVMSGVTVCMWIKFPAVPITGIPFNKEGSIRLFVAEANTTNFTVRLGSSWTTVLTGTSTLQPNVWYYSCVTFDGVNVTLYLNNNIEHTRSMPGTFTNTGPIHIGTFSTASNFSNSKISAIHMYNRALTPLEIAKNFNATRRRYGI